jgi:stearoyl-CoA desaturase (delta-9 desaturase)
LTRVIASRVPAQPISAQVRTAFLLIVLQAIPIAVLFTGTNSTDWLIFAFVYPIQCIGVGVSLHRYFAHRSFKTSRWFQFVLALMASSFFGDTVRFTGKHRLHHRYSDTTNDTHTPLKGFLVMLVWQPGRQWLYRR